VRLISALIEAGQRRRGVRNTTVANARYIAGIANNLSPSFYNFNLNDMDREVSWFEASLPQRQRYLSTDETSDITAFLGTAKCVVGDGRTYRTKLERVEDLRVQLEADIDKYEKQHREDLEPGRHLWDLRDLLRYLDQQYRRFNEKPDDRGNILSTTIAAAKTDSSLANVPKRIRSTVDDYLEALRRLPTSRSGLLDDVSTLQNQRVKLETNIYTEHREFE
jgi:hypothetical protein